jgi:hypothetical protein
MPIILFERHLFPGTGMFYDLTTFTSNIDNADSWGPIYARLSGENGRTRWERLEFMGK